MSHHDAGSQGAFGAMECNDGSPRTKPAAEGPIFVVGSGRCGTTLLQSMLNAHPRIAIPHEEDLHLRLARRWRGVQCATPKQQALFLDDVFASRAFEKWHLPRSRVEAQLRQLQPQNTTYGEILRAVHIAYSTLHGEAKERWGAKVPYYVSHLDFLASLFPDLKIIHIVRDGRDVLLSMRDRARKGATQFETRVTPAALQWRVQLFRAASAIRRLGPQRIHEVRYEELVREPEPILEGICQFIGEMYCEAMLSDFYERTLAMQVHTAERIDLYLRPVVTLARCTRWRSELSAKECEHFEAIAGPALRMHSYELRFPAPRALSRLRGAVTWQGYRAFSNLPNPIKSIFKRYVGTTGRSNRNGFATTT